MPHGFFILQRFFLRVDNVLFRIFDTRVYHAFGSNEIIRETKGRQASYEDIKSVSQKKVAQAQHMETILIVDAPDLQRLPTDKQDDLSPLTDSNWVGQALGMLSTDKPPSISSPSTKHDEQATKPWKGLINKLEILRI